MRPVVRSGSVLRSVGEEGLELSMGVSPGPLLASSERRVVIGRLPFSRRKLHLLTTSSLISIQDNRTPVHPANAVVKVRLFCRTSERRSHWVTASESEGTWLVASERLLTIMSASTIPKRALIASRFPAKPHRPIPIRDCGNRSRSFL
jgi:hypothetical protein